MSQESPCSDLSESSTSTGCLGNDDREPLAVGEWVEFNSVVCEILALDGDRAEILIGVLIDTPAISRWVPTSELKPLAKIQDNYGIWYEIEKTQAGVPIWHNRTLETIEDADTYVVLERRQSSLLVVREGTRPKRSDSEGWQQGCVNPLEIKTIENASNAPDVINENGKDHLLISAIRRDGGTQPRVAVDRAIAEEYAQARRDGAELPPVVVFYDGQSYWLGDGFHRVEAEEIVGSDHVLADIRQGTRRDAILYSVGANATHGLRRTNADKKRAVQTLLKDEEWTKWGNREIARRAGVDEKTVRNLRAELSADFPQMSKTVQRGGTTYTQQTTNIGKSAPANSESPKAEQTITVTTSTSTTTTDDPEPPKAEQATPTIAATKPQKPQLEVFPRTAFISDNCPDDKLRGQTVTLISRPNPDLYLVDTGSDRETIRACYVQEQRDLPKSETKTEQAVDFIIATAANLSNSQVDRLLKALVQNHPNAIAALLNEGNEEIAL
ncbi:hypothetical protein [Scytonema hofmannii]|uniref:hypothetical protein n=1 Tax=Scytonema hofmannii TaxID=34078 RepID=UPI00191C7003